MWSNEYSRQSLTQEAFLILFFSSNMENPSHNLLQIIFWGICGKLGLYLFIYVQVNIIL